jgi:type IV secretory pathway VirD2 relaxase
MSRYSWSDRDGPFFRPRMGRGGGGVEPATRMTMKRAVLQRLARALGSGRRLSDRPSGQKGRARCDVRLPPGARRCVVKASYVRLSGGGAKAARAHLAYIERDGVERDGSPGQMFDAAGDVQRKEFAAPIDCEKLQFRFIIAPEDGDELDVREYTRRLVGRMEKDLGRELRWAAVCHYNTDNPHVHLVVRGVDAEGRELRIDRTYLSESLRLRAQELATKELGPRTELDARRQLDREVFQERLTSIDRRLAALATPDQSIHMRDIASAADREKVSRSHAIGRLDFLEKLQLAERISPASWRFEDGWQQALKDLGERGDIIKRMHHALEGRAADHRIFQPEAGAAVEGIVKQKGLHDELRGDQYVILQTARMEAVYVRLDATTAATLKEGAAVRLVSQRQPWVTGTDRAIQREAVANGGIYSPTAHLRRLGDMPVAVGGRWAQPKDVIAANERRLERLARHNLVEKMREGTWRVPPNLIDTLHSREQTHPRLRIVVELPGPEVDRGRKRGPSFDR